MNRRRPLIAAAVALAVLFVARPSHAQDPQLRQSRMDFINAPLADVLRSVAAGIGLSVVVTDVPTEKRASFSSVGPIGREELIAVLESLLDGNGLVMIQRGTVVQIVPAEKAPPPGEVGVGFTIASPPPLGLISQLVPLTAMRAEEAADALRRVATKEARIEVVPRNNAVLIIDRGTNVAKYLELLKRLDERPQGESGLATYVVPLRFADADEMASSLGQLFGIAVSPSRTGSLSDRSLTSTLGQFRLREMEAFQSRQVPVTQLYLPPQVVQQTPRDTTAGAAQSPGALVGRTTIVPSVPTNSLIIRTSPPNFPLLRETIQALDTRPPQVLLEVAVAEVTLGRGEDFGIDWITKGGSTTASLGNPNAADSAGGLGDFVVKVVSLERVDVRALLRMLASRSDVKVLSTPQVLAVNNREARILVGSKVPFVASTRLGNDVAIDRTVQYQDVGTNLIIIPTINSEDYISVEVLQEVSTLTTQTIQAALNAPVISTREAATRAIIRNGQTVVIGGLIGNSTEVRDSGVPFLKDLPIIGFLFKRSSRNRSRTELAIFVTPYIVRTDAEADAIRERVRSRMDSIGTAADSIRKKP
ncbi:MAG: secretin N-terminal domain-containing protein [Gemmatimonadaceae bacterium]